MTSDASWSLFLHLSRFSSSDMRSSSSGSSAADVSIGAKQMATDTECEGAVEGMVKSG